MAEQADSIFAAGLAFWPFSQGVSLLMFSAASFLILF
jgi:hypothetical protein